MIFRRKRYKLPKFPPSLIPIFKSLSVSVDEEHISTIRSQIILRFKEREEELNKTAGFNRDLAQALLDRSLFLLDNYKSIPVGQRHLAIGAVRYCAAISDAMDESIFASGQRDDTQVMNHVLEELGFYEQIIELAD